MNLKNLKYMFFLLMTALVLSSCSETDDDSQAEFANWQARNDQAFADTLAFARQQINAGSTEWKVIRNWSLNNQTGNKDQAGNQYTPSYKDDEYIVVHVLGKGSSEVSPLYTDSIQMSYRGRLIPTTSYKDGYVYDQTFSGTYDATKALPTKGVANSWIDGFTTALQNMHVGDHWQVFIPQNLGYGSEVKTGIPAYSMLRFELILNGVKHGNGAWVMK